jgi:hypothetical protein
MPGRRPSLVEIFPKEWLPISGLKYLKGVLGLYNNYPFFARDVFRFREAVMGAIDGGKFTIFVFQYTSQEECQRRYQEVKAAFEKSVDYKSFRNIQPDFFATTDGQGLTIFGQSFADCIVLVLTKENEKSAAEILASLKNNYPKIK